MAVQLDDFADSSELPCYLTRFTGRERELAELRALIDRTEARLVTVAGPGGVGKTRLVVEALAGEPVPGRPAPIFLDCAPLNQGDEVLPALALRFGLEQLTDRSSGELLSEAIAGEAVLVVLDNMEHLISSSLELGALLRACPGLRIFITSRTPMKLSHERLMVLEPLPVATNGNTEWSSSATLLLDRAALAGATFPNGDPPTAVIESICARLDGLPLAIELAAPRLRVLSPEALLALLTRQLTLVGSGPIDSSARHQTLHAAIAWSYALLDEDDRRLIRWLGVFPESFSLDLAAQLCFPNMPDAIREPHTLDRLSELFDQGLLQRAGGEVVGQVRFRMLVSIRTFANEQLIESGELELAQARLATICEHLVARLEPELTGEHQGDAMNLLGAESATIRAAFDWAANHNATETGLRLVAGLWRFWANRGLYQDARSHIDRVFAGVVPESTPVWGAALRGAAVIAELQTDWAAARTWGASAISIWEALDDPAQLARSWVDLGNASSSTGEFAEALAAYERANTYAVNAGDLRMETVARCSAGNVALRQGQPAKAVAEFEIALPRMRALRDQWLLAMTLANYAIALIRLGQHKQAIAHLNECLVIRNDLGDESGRAMALLTLEEAIGEAELGGSRTREALEIAQRIGAPDLIAPANVNLGARALQDGDTRLAATYLSAALRAFQAAESPIFASETIDLIAELAEARDPALAARLMGGAAAVRSARSVEWEGQHAPRSKALEKRLERALGEDVAASQRQAGAEMEFHALTIEALLLAQEQGRERETAPGAGVPRIDLTARELMVLKLIVDGRSDREIGAELFISPKTANRHVMSILAKLDSRNRTAATARAMQLGLV